MTSRSDDLFNNKTLILFSVCVLIFIISYQISKKTTSPEYELERQLWDSISSNEIALFRAVIEENILDTAQISEIKTCRVRIQQLNDSAVKISDAIPYGTVISRNGHLVGAAARAAELSRQADNIESYLRDLEHEIARQKGSLLRDSAHIALWKENIWLHDDIKSMQERHPKYYEGGWGNAFRVLHIIFFLLCIVSGVIGGFLALAFIFKILFS